MSQDHFGPDVAARYDDDSAAMFGPEVVGPPSMLEALAAGGPALELAIGTDRVGLPLAARGVPVTGIEPSAAMVEKLRAKPGGADIPVTLGDMATTRVAGTFALIYLVLNTIVNLISQDAQVDCFANAAMHLDPGGCFVVEVNVPQLRRLPPGEHANVSPPAATTGDRRVRRGRAEARLAPLQGNGARLPPSVDPVPLSVAVRARSDGPARRTAAAEPMARLARIAVHG
jgi:SAM-dependent methyltransferase